MKKIAAILVGALIGGRRFYVMPKAGSKKDVDGRNGYGCRHN